MAAPGPASARRRALGTAGEDRAERWYVAHGYQVLARNWRSASGEIDLIARRDAQLVFCEVKTRSGTAYGRPYEAVGRAKQLRIRRLAAEWLRAARPGRGPAGGFDLRFDVVSVLGDRVEVLEGAF